MNLCILQTTSSSFSLLSPWLQSECPSFPHRTLGLRKRESYIHCANPKRSPRPTSRVFLPYSTCFKDGSVCVLQSPPHSQRYSTDASFSSLKIAGERFTSHRNVNFNKEIARGHTSPLHHYHHKHAQQQFTNTCDPQALAPSLTFPVFLGNIQKLSNLFFGLNLPTEGLFRNLRCEWGVSFSLIKTKEMGKRTNRSRYNK